MRENRTPGSVQGAPGNRRSYCDAVNIFENSLRRFDRGKIEGNGENVWLVPHNNGSANLVVQISDAGIVQRLEWKSTASHS